MVKYIRINDYDYILTEIPIIKDSKSMELNCIANNENNHFDRFKGKTVTVNIEKNNGIHIFNGRLAMYSTIVAYGYIFCTILIDEIDPKFIEAYIT